MSSSSSQYSQQAGWSWANLTHQDLTGSHVTNPPGAFTPEEPEIPEAFATPEERPDEANPPPQTHQRRYSPRTCRICLEEVLPTFEVAAEGAMFNPAPRVLYVSSDPASGRLIRPCKCRGSQAYVHEGCLQEWRHADPSYGRRTFWECPTCKFQYRLTRMKWSRWLTSTSLQIVITIGIMLTTIFAFGFIADPIINLYLDPYDTITSTATGGSMPRLHIEDADDSWAEHFLKGLASLGLLGFVKVFFAMTPWWNIRQGLVFGGGRGRRGGGGRERLENISWTVVVIGVITFLYAVWRWVRAWTARTLEKAGERVSDVQSVDDDEEDEDADDHPSSAETAQTSTPVDADIRKMQ